MQRVCLELHYVWGYTVGEIAARLGLTDGQVKGHVQRALRHLRESRKESGQVSEFDQADESAMDARLRQHGEALRAERDGCPHPELLFARQSEALDADVRDRIRVHMSRRAWPAGVWPRTSTDSAWPSRMPRSRRACWRE